MSRKSNSRKNTESTTTNNKENEMTRKQTPKTNSTIVAVTAWETAESLGIRLPRTLLPEDVMEIVPQVIALRAEIKRRAAKLVEGTVDLSFVAPEEGKDVNLVATTFENSKFNDGEIWKAKIVPSTALANDKCYRMSRLGENGWFKAHTWEICCVMGAGEGLYYYRLGLVNGVPNYYFQLLRNCSTLFGNTCERVAVVDVQQWGGKTSLNLSNVPVTKTGVDKNGNLDGTERTIICRGELTHPYIKFPNAFIYFRDGASWKVEYPSFFTVKLNKELELGELETDNEGLTFGVDPIVWQNAYHNYIEQLVLGVPYYLETGSYEKLGKNGKFLDRRMATKAAALQRRIGLGSVVAMKKDRKETLQSEETFQTTMRAWNRAVANGTAPKADEPLMVNVVVGKETMMMPFEELDKSLRYDLRRLGGFGSLVDGHQAMDVASNKKCTQNAMRRWFNPEMGWGFRVNEGDEN